MGNRIRKGFQLFVRRFEQRGPLGHPLFQALAELPNILLCPLAFRDVHNGREHEPALFRFDRHEADFDRELASVLPLSEQISASTHRTRRRVGEESVAIFGMLRSEPLRHQQFHGLPQEFIAGVTEDLLGLRVDQDDTPLGVDHQHSVRSRLHGEPKFLLGSLPLGNVDDRARTSSPSSVSIGVNPISTGNSLPSLR